MNGRRLTCILALVVVFLTCVTGKNDVPPGCKVEDFGKLLQCRGAGLNMIPKTIPEGVMKVDFKDNNIKHIGVNDSQTFLRLRKVYLSGNPLHCDCNLSHFRRLLVKNKVYAVKDGARIQCASPLHVQNQTLISLSHRQLCGKLCRTCQAVYNNLYLDEYCNGLKTPRVELCAASCLNDVMSSFYARTCTDIDECNTTADCKTIGNKCHNTIGGFECKCDPGFRYNEQLKKCMDVDECKLRRSNCSHHSFCKNTHGGFKCVCPENYKLSDFKCIPNDMTRWIIPKYLLQDIVDGVWSRIIAIGAVAVILVSLCVLVVVGIRKMRRKCAEKREMKRLAYEDMEYNDEMGYSEENFDNDKPNISPMTTNENFDQMVPLTYHEDDQYEDNFEREGKTY